MSFNQQMAEFQPRNGRFSLFFVTDQPTRSYGPSLSKESIGRRTDTEQDRHIVAALVCDDEVEFAIIVQITDGNRTGRGAGWEAGGGSYQGEAS